MARGSRSTKVLREVQAKVHSLMHAIQLSGDVAGVFERFEACGSGFMVEPSPNTGVAVTVVCMPKKENARPILIGTPIVGPVRRKRIGRW